jgi:pantoate--beta-alanine ligase
VCPIVRDADGLALSSRNVYLSPTERMQALALNRTIRLVETLSASGERNRSVLVSAARKVISAVPEVQVDYVALVDWSTLQPVDVAEPGSLFAVAAKVGPTRLIDNTILA